MENVRTTTGAMTRSSDARCALSSVHFVNWELLRCRKFNPFSFVYFLDFNLLNSFMVYIYNSIWIVEIKVKEIAPLKYIILRFL